MSTYLDLTNKVLRKLNEAELTDANFGSARNVHAHAKDAIIEAVRDINNYEIKWPFNYAQYSYTLTPGVHKYAAPTSTRYISFSTIRLNFDESLGSSNSPLKAINYEDWVRYHRNSDKASDSTTWRLPYYCFRCPDDSIGISGIPDKAYTMTIDRYVIPVDMSASTDVCNIPTDFDSVIVQRALYHLYMFRGNTEQAAYTDKRSTTNIANMRTILLNHAENVSTTFITSSRGNGMGAYYANGYI